MPEIIPEYFVLGTMRDYDANGRFYSIQSDQVVENYKMTDGEREKNTMYYMYDYIKRHLDNNVSIDTLNSVIYSPIVAKKMNRFYNEKGQLVRSLFVTIEQKQSFVLGQYLRFGCLNEEKIYMIISPGQSPMANILYELLYEIRCRKITYELVQTIPTSSLFTFVASAKFQRYMDVLSESEKEFDRENVELNIRH